MYEEQKIAEAQYFLEQMESTKDDEKAFQYNLSAFLAASRSVLLYAKGRSEKPAKRLGLVHNDHCLQTHPKILRRPAEY
jgi:hypothetical protein